MVSVTREDDISAADLPRKDGLSTQIQYSAHVQHAARNRDVGDVRYPELIGLRLIEVPIQQIGIPVDGLLITGIRPAAANDRQQVQLAHHTQDCLDIHQLPGPALNPAPNAANAVGLLALPLARHDQVNQPLILCFFLLPVSPGIISAAGLLQTLRTWLLCCIFRGIAQSPGLQFHLLPASDRKFRSNSTCIRSFANSLRCFPSSLTGSLWGRPLGRGMYPAANIRSFLRCRSSGSSLVAFPDRSWLLFRHMSPLILSPSYNFNQLPHLCVLSCHTENLLSQFLFYNRRPLFSFVRCLGNCPNTGGAINPCQGCCLNVAHDKVVDLIKNNYLLERFICLKVSFPKDQHVNIFHIPNG